MRTRPSRAGLVGLAISLVGAAPPDAGSPSEISFAEQAFGGWRAKAVTKVEYEVDANRKGPFPYARDVVCEVQRNGMAVWLDRKGRYSIDLSGENPSADEENSDFGKLNVRSLRIDRIPYEAKAVQTVYARRKFGDVDYPPVEGDGIMLPVFGGYVAVRRNPSEPWLEITQLIPELLRARTVRIGHGRQVDGRVPRIYHLTLSLAELRPALKWCEGQVQSEAAYRFRAR